MEEEERREFYFDLQFDGGEQVCFFVFVFLPLGSVFMCCKHVRQGFRRQWQSVLFTKLKIRVFS